MLRVDIVTLFPDLFGPILEASILGRAQTAGAFSWAVTNPRDFAIDRHRSVDDRPYGGGPGMVLKCEPLFAAVDHAIEQGRAALGDAEAAPQVILLTPQGERFGQRAAVGLAGEPWLLLICGHYEGFDERIRLGLSPRELSVGDYVLTGGELPALVVIDAVVRLLPGALGDDASADYESFGAHGPSAPPLLDCPHYTRPAEFRGMRVPEVLVSGDHEAVARWRHEQALARTRERRPDLLAGHDVSSALDEEALRRDADVIRRPRGEAAQTDADLPPTT